MSVDPSSVPVALREREQWVVWRAERRAGKQTKIPYRADGSGRASTTDPATWGSFDAALAAVAALEMNGVGYVFSADDPYVGIDLDEGLPASDRTAIVEALASYTETSVSGTGVHVIAEATMPALARNRHGPLEVYEQGRYFVMTGAHVAGTPTRVERRQIELETILEHYLPPPQPATPRAVQPVELDDRELLERAFRARGGDEFERLHRGDTAGYPSQSEADLAFCGFAAFWTGRDPARIDQWMRSSGLMRAKWERADYRQRTIDAAVAGTRETYEPRRNGNEPSDPRRRSADDEPPTGTTDDPRQGQAPAHLQIVPMEAFAAVDEPGAGELVGEPGQALVPEGANVMIYGDGGAGKTTLTIDLACHLAAGDDWIGITVASTVTSLIIEDEGPRPFFRRKLARKLRGWAGSPIEGRVFIVESPWARFTFAEESHRAALAEAIDRLELAIVIVGPVVVAGMETAGTLQDVRAFLALVDDVRDRSQRAAVTFILVHHENKGGEVSGAWEGAGDTLIHLNAQGHGKTRFHVQKARQAPEYHLRTLTLKWADDEGFEVVADQPVGDDELQAKLLAAVRHEPGISWSSLLKAGRKAQKGGGDDRWRGARDHLLDAGAIVNKRREAGGGEVALAYVLEASPAHFHPADDPLIQHLLPAQKRPDESVTKSAGHDSDEGDLEWR